MNIIQKRAEETILKALITEQNHIHKIMAKISEDMFYINSHQLIFKVIYKLYLVQEEINLITVYKELPNEKSMFVNEAKDDLQKIHSSSQISVNLELATSISVLTAESIRNEHIDLANQISKIASEDTYTPVKVLDLVQNHIADNKFKSFLNRKDVDNKTLVEELEKKMKEASENKGVNGIKTGYNRFDYVTSGMQPTNLIVVAARPAMGKTQFGLGIMRHASIKYNKKGLFISCEMDEVQVMKRILAIDSGVKGYSIKKGKLLPHEKGRFERAKRRVISSGIKIVAGSFTISDVMSLIYKMKYAEGLDYVVVDYIQKITAPGTQNRTNEVGEVSRKLKDIANELKIPIVALAQLSRNVEYRTDKRPMLSDLRESGDIEQDADIVTFLYRPSYYNTSPEENTDKTGFAIIAKHRDGELEDIMLEFEGEIPAWKNTGHIEDYDDEFIQVNMNKVLGEN
tara:strand:- start:2003 stop:3373 length:1371 start_codon:yes stop_codon:yes gene_type:complete